MMRPGPVVRGCVQLNFGSFAPPHDANDVKFDEMIAGIFTVFSTVYGACGLGLGEETVTVM